MDASVVCLSHVIIDLMNCLFPMRRFRAKNRSQIWAILPKARSIRKARRKALRNAINVGTSDAWTQYRSARNQANKALKVLKSEYFSLATEKLRSKPGEFWKVFSPIIKSGICVLFQLMI